MSGEFVEIDPCIMLNGLGVDGVNASRVEVRIDGHTCGGTVRLGAITDAVFCQFLPPSSTGLIKAFRQRLTAGQELGLKALAMALSEPTMSFGWLHVGRVDVAEEYRGMGVARFAVKDLIESIGVDCIVTVPVTSSQAQAVADFGISNPLMVEGQLMLWMDSQYKTQGYLAEPRRGGMVA
tara:strand:+ start:31959 stop:32498 length:540 start_codon:yes stop_codon:yes gene_type:complete